MDYDELRAWVRTTQESTHGWTEDPITRINGNGALYYRGGTDGIYIRVSPEGELTLGTYEGSYPHIGEANFTVKAAKQYENYDRAMEAILKIAGVRFLMDLFCRTEKYAPGMQHTNSQSFEMNM